MGDSGHDLDSGLVSADADPDRLSEVVEDEVPVAVDGQVSTTLLAQHGADEAEEFVAVARLKHELAQGRLVNDSLRLVERDLAGRAQAEKLGLVGSGTPRQDLVDRRGAVPEPSPAAGRRWTVDLLDELGYAPDADAEASTVVLRRCPLLQAAHRFPDVVCSVHLGMVQAALERNGAPADETELTPFSAPGECLLKLGA